MGGCRTQPRRAAAALAAPVDGGAPGPVCALSSGEGVRLMLPEPSMSRLPLCEEATPRSQGLAGGFIRAWGGGCSGLGGLSLMSVCEGEGVGGGAKRTLPILHTY